MTSLSKAQRLIERYLHRVGKALHHLDPGERGEILADLRSHIQEELARRQVTHPSPQDVAAVLAGMETPESFRPDGASSTAPWPSRSRTFGRLALIALVSALGVFLLSLLLGNLVAEAWLRGGVLLTLVLSVAALALGIAGWRHPYGKGAAITAIVMLVVASFMFPARRTASQSGSPEPIIEERATGEEV